MPIKQVIHGHGVPIKIWTDECDEKSKRQLELVADLPFVHHHVAAMPDVHVGIGATVGSVIATRNAIIPAAVGVDIGCGMAAVRLSLSANDLDEKSLKTIFHQISRDVPVGRDQHADDRVLLDAALQFQAGLNQLIANHPTLPKMFGRTMKWINQMGTLGGGNHFIEICLDEVDAVWIMLHSGSRGLGNALASYFIELAREEMQQHMIHLPDQDLAYFSEGSRYFDDYMVAVGLAQDYASQNRACMMQLVLSALRRHLPPFVVTHDEVNCHHNYVSQEFHYGADVYVTRKGAIRALDGELGIIPGSMGAKSFIVCGRGNKESFESSSHGAGRLMSRSEAIKRFSKEDLIRQTKGIVCRKDKHVIDEIPGAYKSIDSVMANQSDLVSIRHTLRQLLCIKG